MMMVVALLAVLAYGSFAFGKYVLSAKLFGDDVKPSSLRSVSRSTSEASAITRQTGWKGAKPRVEVKVLPAGETASSGDLPAFADEDGFKKQRDDDADEDRHETAAPEPTPRVHLGKREFDDASVEYSLGEDKSERKRKPRRRRRTHTRKSEKAEQSTSSKTSDSAQVTAQADSSASENRNSDSASSSDSSSDSSSREQSSDNDRPRESTRSRERTRTRSEERPRRQRSTSPIPRPEGLSSSGGDSAEISPVPKPE